MTGTGWRVDTEVQNDATIHVWPDSDAVGHDLQGAGCICGPALEEQHNGRVLVTHRRLDATRDEVTG